MTRREVIEILRPKDVDDLYTGGVRGCPDQELSYQGRVFHFDKVESCCAACWICWNKELSITERVSLLDTAGADVIRAYLSRKRNESVQK